MPRIWNIINEWNKMWENNHSLPGIIDNRHLIECFSKNNNEKKIWEKVGFERKIISNKILHETLIIVLEYSKENVHIIFQSIFQSFSSNIEHLFSLNIYQTLDKTLLNTPDFLHYTLYKIKNFLGHLIPGNTEVRSCL